MQPPALPTHTPQGDTYTYRGCMNIPSTDMNGCVANISTCSGWCDSACCSLKHPSQIQEHSTFLMMRRTIAVAIFYTAIHNAIMTQDITRIDQIMSTSHLHLPLRPRGALSSTNRHLLAAMALLFEQNCTNTTRNNDATTLLNKHKQHSNILTSTSSINIECFDEFNSPRVFLNNDSQSITASTHVKTETVCA